MARGVTLSKPNGTAVLCKAGKGNGASLQTIKSNADSFARDLGPEIDRLRTARQTSPPQIAAALNDGEFSARRGGIWPPSTVNNLL